MSEIADGSADNRVARLRPVGGSTKRLIDIVLATTGILLLLPLLGVCTLGTLLTSQGSILARHRRVGFRGRYFDCLKFKTMAPNTNERLSKHLGYGPRVTRFGAILRKAGLDALPQLFNVLRGDMSIVGPRPVTDEELQKYSHRASAYLACKPGITGLWQISGRSRTGCRERVVLDYTYAKNWSLMMDAKTMLLTLPVRRASDNPY